MFSISIQYIYIYWLHAFNHLVATFCGACSQEHSSEYPKEYSKEHPTTDRSDT